jgi:hypothetical protein
VLAGTKAFDGFAVDDLAKAGKSRSTTSTKPSNELTARAVRFERYDGFEQDEKGISGDCLLIATFEDPAGNALSVLEET